MKRYIKSSADIAMIEQQLKELFTPQNIVSLVHDGTSSTEASIGLVSDYVVSRRLSGRGIELYKRTYDPETSKSFGGGSTLARGYNSVAQHVASIDPDLDNWGHVKNL